MGTALLNESDSNIEDEVHGILSNETLQFPYDWSEVSPLAVPPEVFSDRHPGEFPERVGRACRPPQSLHQLRENISNKISKFSVELIPLDCC